MEAHGKISKALCYSIHEYNEVFSDAFDAASVELFLIGSVLKNPTA
jgi:hypothetical protein